MEGGERRKDGPNVCVCWFYNKHINNCSVVCDLLGMFLPGPAVFYSGDRNSYIVKEARAASDRGNKITRLSNHKQGQE